jgi:O-antigen/teichoic acid export membrane protein
MVRDRVRDEMTRRGIAGAVPVARGGSLRGASRALLQAAVGSPFVRKVAGTFATRILLVAAGLATSVLTARALGPEGRGLCAVAATIGTLGAQFGNLGLHASNTYYVSRDRSLLPALVGNSLLVSFAGGSFGAVAAWTAVSIWPGLAPVRGWLLVLALAGIPLGLAQMLIQNLLLGIGEVRAYNAIDVAAKIGWVCLIGLLILLRPVTPEIIVGAGMVTLAFSLVWALRHLRGHLKQRPAARLSLFRETIRYGFKAYLAAFFAFLVLRIDLLMVQYLVGAEAAGQYSIATSMADFVRLLPVVVGTILFPELSAMPSQAERWRLARKATVLMGLLMLVVVIVAAVLAEPLVRLLYGPAFAPAVPAFVWLMPGTFFLAVEVVAVQFLNSSGFPKQVVGIWGACSVTNISLNLWAIPRYGAVGAAVTSSASSLLVLVLVLRFIERAVRTHDGVPRT